MDTEAIFLEPAAGGQGAVPRCVQGRTYFLRENVTGAEDGTCREATIHTSSGHAILDKAALRMIRAARFRNGPGHIRQPIDFSLR